MDSVKPIIEGNNIRSNKAHSGNYIIDSFNSERSSTKSNSDKNISSINNLNEYIDKIGYSTYQYGLFIRLVILFLADGAEMVLISIILPLVTEFWNLTSFEKSILFSITLCGIFVGTYYASIAADKYGRKNLIILGNIVVAVIGICSGILSFNLFLLVFFRFLMGAGIGIIIPTSNSLAAESIPSYYRSFYISNIWLCYPLGVLFLCIGGIYLTPEYKPEDWSKMVLWAAVPSFFSLAIIISIKESPRFLLIQGRYEEAFEILNHYGQSKGIELTDSDKKVIRDEFEVNNSDKNKEEPSFKNLFSKKYKKLTLMIIYLFSMCSILSMGRTYLMPLMLKEKYKDIKKELGVKMFYDIMILSLVMLPTSPITGILSELKYIGRKYCMAIGYFIGGLSCFVSYSNIEYIHITNGILHLGFGICFCMLSVYSSEVYPTEFRTIGMACGYIASRIGGISSPFFNEILMKLFTFSQIDIIYTILSFSGCIVCYFLEKETHNQPLVDYETQDILIKDEVTLQLRDSI